MYNVYMLYAAQLSVRFLFLFVTCSCFVVKLLFVVSSAAVTFSSQKTQSSASSPHWAAMVRHFYCVIAPCIKLPLSMVRAAPSVEDNQITDEPVETEWCLSG